MCDRSAWRNRALINKKEKEKRQIKDQYAPAEKGSLLQLFSGLCGISDVAFVERPGVIGSVAERLLELELVNGSCEVSERKKEKKTRHKSE